MIEMQEVKERARDSKGIHRGYRWREAGRFIGWIWKRGDSMSVRYQKRKIKRQYAQGKE